MIWDAIVIGTGPSGIACAYFLSKQGAKVLLLEKQLSPPDKPCAGGLDGLAYRLFPQEVEQCSPTEIRQLRFLINNKSYSYSFPYPVFRLVDRKKFIQSLLQKAINAGTQFYDQSPAELADEFTVRSGIRIEKGRFIVDASGVRSKIALRLGAKYSLYPTISADIPFSEQPPKYEKTAIFELYTEGKGYSWLFPKKEYLSVGSGGEGKVKKRFLAFLEAQKLKALKVRGWLLPVKRPQSSLGNKNILLVGDAAGLVDPLTGAGISWGMLSGKLAAQAILEGDGDKYQKLIEQEILADFKVADRLFRLLPWLIKLKIVPQRKLLIQFIAGVVAGKFHYRDIWQIGLNFLKARI